MKPLATWLGLVAGIPGPLEGTLGLLPAVGLLQTGLVVLAQAEDARKLRSLSLTKAGAASEARGTAISSTIERTTSEELGRVPPSMELMKGLLRARTRAI